MIDRTFDTRDRVYALLRGLALLAGLGYAAAPAPAVSPPGAGPAALAEGFAVFGAYSLALYAGAFRPLARRGRKPLFYAVAAVLDLGFAVWLVAATGGAHSPMIRALYLWVAIHAFYFGLRVGAVASVCAFAVTLGFTWAASRGGSGWPSAGSGGAEPWALALQAGGLLMHGPLIGFLADRERARAEALRRARDELLAANRGLVEERAKLAQAEKLSSIGLLAAGVAHEVNNPLAGVMGCVKALRDGSVPAPRRAEYFDAVGDGLERIRAIVQGLLDYSRQRPPAPTREDVAELVASCVRLLHPLERRKGLRVDDSALVRGQHAVMADRGQLMQALVNVLVNAIQAVPAGGRIEVAAREDGERVGIVVRDEGAGIPAEVLDKVCDPFFTTKPPGEGTGLGLAITLGILRAHGGDLTVASAEGKGTEVTLWLPRCKRQPTAVARTS